MGSGCKNSVAVLTRLGRIGTLVMIRKTAFILLCIGIEIMWTGWTQLKGWRIERKIGGMRPSSGRPRDIGALCYLLSFRNERIPMA